jgi:hypothetical protein
MITTLLVVCMVFPLCSSWSPQPYVLARRLSQLSPLAISTSEDMKVAPQYIRPLGGYERLLSRKAPAPDSGDSEPVDNDGYLALSHTAAFMLSSAVPHNILVEAVIAVIKRHPILRAYISDGPGNQKTWTACEGSVEALAQSVVTSYDTETETAFECEWKDEFSRSLNFAIFPEEGPQWRLTSITLSSKQKQSDDKSSAAQAWVFSMNHGIDDQKSVNIMVDELVYTVNALNKAKGLKKGGEGGGSGSAAATTATTTNASSSPLGDAFPFPDNIEKAIAPGLPNLRTLLWAAFQVCNSLAKPLMIPLRIQKRVTAESKDPWSRQTFW